MGFVSRTINVFIKRREICQVLPSLIPPFLSKRFFFFFYNLTKLASFFFSFS